MIVRLPKLVFLICATCAALQLTSCELFVDRTDYYVSPGGAPFANGTQSRPFGSPREAASRAGPGDTVHILPGVYPQRLVLTRSGEADNPITFQGEAGAIIDVTADPDGSAFSPSETGKGVVHLNGVHDIVFRNIEVAHAPYQGFLVESASANISIYDCTVTASGGSGIEVRDSSDIVITGNTISNEGSGPARAVIQIVYSSSFVVSENTVSTVDVGDSDFEYSGITAGHACTNGVISDNVCRSFNAGAIEIISGVDVHSDIQITGNTITDSKWGIILSVPGGAMSDIDVANNALDAIDMSAIWINTHSVDSPTRSLARIHIASNMVTASRMGVVLEILEGASMSDSDIVNNVVWNSTQYGMLISGNFDPTDTPPAMSNLRVLNNTIYKSNSLDEYAWGGCLNIGKHWTDTSSFLVRNNIISEGSDYSCFVSDALRSSAVTVDHNLFTQVSAYAADTHGTASIETSDPGFTNSVAGDFSLLATSAAVDAGSATEAPAVDIALTSRPQGAGIDIGAYERSE
jgi:parallel beta-helix repeat protein